VGLSAILEVGLGPQLALGSKMSFLGRGARLEFEVQEQVIERNG